VTCKPQAEFAAGRDAMQLTVERPPAALFRGIAAHENRRGSQKLPLLKGWALVAASASAMLSPSPSPDAQTAVEALVASVLEAVVRRREIQ